MGYKVLFITRHYLDDNNGGANASKGFIHAFTRVFGAMDVIYPEHEGTDCSFFVPSTCVLYPCYDKRSTIQKGLDMYRGRLHRFTGYVTNHLAKSRYDVIVIDHSLTAASLTDVIRKNADKVITIHHNVERDYIKDNEPSVLFRLPYDHFVRKAERDALLASDINFTLTEKDAQTFRSWYPERDMHVHNLGICEYRKPEDVRFSLENIKDHIFIITGSLCFKQSLRPIIEFITKYYPILKEECPDAKLIVAGRNPNHELVELCSKDNSIHIIPNPKEMKDVVSLANYYICPINAGSGIKLRIMDGLKQGLPVLAHDIASRGYDYISAAGYLFSYHNRETFRSSLSEMLKKQISPETVYESFIHVFSLEACSIRLKNILLKEYIVQ